LPKLAKLRPFKTRIFIFHKLVYLLLSGIVRNFLIIVLLICVGLHPGLADTFKLANGETLTGEALLASGNDAGIQIKLGEGEYQRVPWANFSQEDLKKFAQNQKLEPFVEPFIEITEAERIAKTEVAIRQPPRLDQPAKQSLLAAMFGSGIGIVLLLVLYAANIYAGYEVAIFRAQSVALVCGVSAVLPIIGPIIFLSMPTKVQSGAETGETVPAAEAAPASVTGEATADSVNPMLDPGAAHPAGLKIAHSEQDPEKPAHPPTTTYARGQFTFNRRFFETKFPGFFGTVRRDADRDMVLVFKCNRGEFVGHRITRISASDLHLEVHKGHAAEEVTIPFQDVQEIRHKHKDA
jgi:hypothetical protein